MPNLADGAGIYCKRVWKNTTRCLGIRATNVSPRQPKFEFQFDQMLFPQIADLGKFPIDLFHTNTLSKVKSLNMVSSFTLHLCIGYSLLI